MLCDLVDFVEDEYRVRRASLLNGLDDASRHSAHIGATVTANFAFVVQTAQAHAHVFALHGGGYRFAQRCLADSRRAVETDDGALQVATQLQNGHVFQYALLHLLHSVVVAVKDFLCTLQIEVVVCVFSPRQIHHRLQVVHLHAVLRSLRVEHVELVEFLEEHLLNVFRPLLAECLYFEVVTLRRAVAVAQFFLDVLDLLLQEVLALLFVDVFARLGSNVLTQLQQLYLLVERLQYEDHAIHHRVGLQHLDLIAYAERQVRTDEVQGEYVVLDVVQSKLRLVGDVLVLMDVFNGLVAKVFDSRTPRLIVTVGHLFRHQRGGAHEVGAMTRDAIELTAPQSLYDDCYVVVWTGHVEHANQFGIGAKFVKVFL